MIKKNDSEENFLESRTFIFICDVFNAKISKKQCQYQCIKSVRSIREYCETGGIIDNDTKRSLQCIQCRKFVKLDEKIIDSFSTVIKRYKDTESGKTDRRIMAYIESNHWLRDEE